MSYFTMSYSIKEIEEIVVKEIDYSDLRPEQRKAVVEFTSGKYVFVDLPTEVTLFF